MLERLIYTALSEDIETYVTDRRVEKIFLVRGVGAVEARKIRETFEARPPSVIHGYPHEDSKFPLYAIVLGDDPETTAYLDNFGGFLSASQAETLLQQGFEGSITRASVYRPEYFIYVVTDNPDLTITYYHILKNILTLRRTWLKEQGVMDTRFGGTDLVPELRYLPSYLFTRRFVVHAEVMEQAYEARDGVATSVRGIHVDDGSTIEELGGVRAHITTEGDES